MNDDDIRNLQMIIEEGDADTLVAFSEELAARVSGDEPLGRTQVRNIYSMVKAFQAKQNRDYGQLTLMLPKLRYAAAREDKLKPLVDALCYGITLVGNDDGRFKNFANFFEAVVAYHYVATAG